VGVGETCGNKAKAVRFGTWVNNYKGAGGPERGARFLRGENSEEGPHERLRHEIRPRNLGLLENR